MDLGFHDPAPATGGDKPKAATVKRDFFGRVIESARPDSSDGGATRKETKSQTGKQEEKLVWVSFHEGSSTAVRKPITLDEFMRGF